MDTDPSFRADKAPSSSSLQSNRRAPFLEKFSSVWPWACPYEIPSWASFPPDRDSMIPVFSSTKEQVMSFPSDQIWDRPFPIGKEETVFGDCGVAARLAENSLTPTDQAFLRDLPAEMISASAIMHTQRLSALLTSLHSRTPIVRLNDDRLEALHRTIILSDKAQRRMEAQLNHAKGELLASEERERVLRDQYVAMDGFRTRSEERANREELRRKELEHKFAQEKEIMGKQIIQLQQNLSNNAKERQAIIKEYQDEVLAGMLDESFNDGFSKCRAEIRKIYPDLKIDWSVINPDAEDPVGTGTATTAPVKGEGSSSMAYKKKK